ncbi:MAG: DUF433 domain-containing protein [Pirellulales bacterium]|nr:DUF433 domain-containing protein [Pirellulales bacterium]
MSTVEYAHITTGPGNVPMLAGTRTKVVELVLDHLAHGADVQEIHREFPHLKTCAATASAKIAAAVGSAGVV